MIKDAFRLRISARIKNLAKIYRGQNLQNASRLFRLLRLRTQKMSAALKFEATLLGLEARHRRKMFASSLGKLNSHMLEKKYNLIKWG